MINGGVEVAGRIIFSNTLVLIPAIGKWGVWLATALTWFITGIVSLIRYRQGKWKTIKLVDKVRDKKEESEQGTLKEIEVSHSY